MNDMSKLLELKNKCKCGISITINQHKNYYDTAEEYFQNNEFMKEYLTEGDIDPEVYEKMKEFDTIIEIQFYPHTPIGFYKIFHYDLEMALDESLNCLKKTMGN